MKGVRSSLPGIGIVLMLFLLYGCRHEYTQSYPAEFEPYVNEFFFQANQRGLEWKPSNFEFHIQFGDTDSGTGGFCNFDHNTITVNPEEWAHRDEQQREHLIFHELGHCLLNRPHKNIESSSGECYSYMKGAENDFTCSLNLYSPYWRKYYIDELFDDSRLLPTWYMDNQAYSNALIDYHNYLLITDTLSDMLDITTFRFSQRDSFLFEIEFDNVTAQEDAVAIFIGNLTFSHCDNCTGSKTNLAINNKIVFSSPDITTHEAVRFSVFKHKDIVSFYVNEYFVHAMEFALIEGNRFKTTTFDEALKMSIRYFYD